MSQPRWLWAPACTAHSAGARYGVDVALLLLSLAACDTPSGLDSATTADLSACECSDSEWYPARPCNPVDPVNCTDCDCDGHTVVDDCNDSDPKVHPGAAEWSDCDDGDASVHGGADGIDNDCDGVVDEDAEAPPEVCNGVDDNCDGRIDEGVTAPYYPDADGDGYGDAGTVILACEAPEGYSGLDGDCDDANSDASPAAVELPKNGIDDDCDGMVDEP